MGRLAALLLLGALPLAGGCSTLRTAGHVLDAVKLVGRGAKQEETAVAFTLENGPEIVALAKGLSQFDVRADIEAIERGIAVVRIVGAYVEVLNAIQWLVDQGAAALLANDELSQTLLYVILKSGG